MSENTEKNTGEKMFTQAELTKLINKRLSRERRNNASLSKVYKLLKELADKKIINASSYAEAAQELYDKLILLCDDENMKTDDGNVGKSGEETEAEIYIELTGEELPVKNLQAEVVCEETAEKAGQECDSIMADEPCEVELPENFADEVYGTDYKECEKEKEHENGLSEISQFLKRFPESRALKIITSHEFIDYCHGRMGGLCELYDDFCKHFDALNSLFDGEKKTESEHLEQGNYENINPRNIISEYSSTGFSGRSASPSCDDGANLSPLQRKIAKSAGISYREYASMLRDIPQYSKSDKRTFTKIRI